MLSADDVLAALRDCFHPRFRCSLVDLGTIRSVHVEPDPDAPGAGIPGVPVRSLASLSLALPGDSTEDDAMVTAQVRNRLAGLESLSRAEILTSEHAWSPADITPTGRRLLGLEGNRTLVQIR